MKWGISPSSEMPHFFVYFPTRTIMVCLRYINFDKILLHKKVLLLEYVFKYRRTWNLIICGWL